MNKSRWRDQLKKRRSALSNERKEEASARLLYSLQALLAPFQKVLSFAHFQDEIDTSPLNIYLATHKKLFLPKVEGTNLVIYRVEDLDSHLIPGYAGIEEPISELCEKEAIDEISIILVPALGFDQNHFRIGYGKGFYDRLLAKACCQTLGIGFREQFVDELPIEAHDIPLSKVYLF